MARFSIHRKLILSYLIFAVLPTIILGVYLSSNIRTITVNKAILDAERHVERILFEVNRSLSIATDISKQLDSSKNFSTLIHQQYASAWDVVDAYYAFEDFENLRKIYQNSIDNIRVFVDNDTILEGWYLNKIDERFFDDDGFATAYRNPNKIVWGRTTDPNAFTKGYACYSLTYYTENLGHPVGLFIDINTDYIDSILNDYFFDTVIFDENENILCASTGAEAYAAAYAATYALEAHDYHTDFVEINTRDEVGRHKIIMKDMAVGGINGRFRIVSSFLLDDLSRESDSLLQRCLIITLACSSLMVFLIYSFSRHLRKRVSALSREMESVSKGNFNLVVEDSYKDEIGVLSQSLNIMAENLRNLEREKNESNRHKQILLAKHNDIKLRLLTNQMNPHFLFNTLESLRMEAHIKDEKEISDVIERLGRLLRKSLQAGSEEYTLAEELRLVQDYLCIQAYRYKDRIQCVLSVCDGVSEMKVLPLILQPIVENAIIHGLETSERQGVIRINVYLEGDLFIEVVDNGVGMTTERLEQLRGSLSAEATDAHIGIHNVHMRLQLQYGAEYGLTIDSEHDIYTKITIRVPARL